MIIYSAPAKIILSGEHTVVYGKPALVSAINLRLTINVETSEAPRQFPRDESITTVNQVVLEYLEKKEIPFDKKEFTYSIESYIPMGRGMGSSAAFCVAGVAALLEFYTGKEWDKETINSLAYQCEKKFHGNPSGVDNSTSCFGGLIFYRKEFEFLKQISSLNFKLPKNIEEKFFLIDSGKPSETTAEMVAGVGKLYNQDAKKMEQVMAQTERVTKRMVVAIVKEDAQMFADCIVENQKLLEEMQVVSDSTKELVQQLSKYGVGKVTGAGGSKTGSGFMLFFAKEANELQKFLDKKNISYFKFVQSIEGIQRHSELDSESH